MYKKFKDMSEWLDSRQLQGLRTFLRIAAPVVVAKTVDLSGVELYDAVSHHYFVLMPHYQSIHE